LTEDAIKTVTHTLVAGEWVAADRKLSQLLENEVRKIDGERNFDGILNLLLARISSQPKIFAKIVLRAENTFRSRRGSFLRYVFVLRKHNLLLSYTLPRTKAGEGEL
jgi:hypothetical protein